MALGSSLAGNSPGRALEILACTGVHWRSATPHLPSCNYQRDSLGYWPNLEAFDAVFCTNS